MRYTEYIRRYPNPRQRKALAKKLRRHKLSLDEWEQLVAEAGGKCMICRRRRKLHIDHDHTTGEIRGLLCRECNLGIAYLGDSAKGLRRALRYLLR